jgi:hypothetical protein
MRLHSEKQACPRKGLQTALEKVLRRRQTEPGRKAFWDPEQADRHPARGWGTGVAKQSLKSVEPGMCTLCTRERCWHEVRDGRQALICQHLHPLGTQELLAGPSMTPATPITPKQGCATHDEGMQEHTHLARLRSGTAQRTLHCSRREQGRQLRMLAA